MPESVADSGIILYNDVMGVRNMANETDQALDKKTLILAEAERIFAEKGYYGLGLSELLKSCDVPKGSFYYYFPGGKKQLLQEALEFSYRRMERGINGHILVEETALASFEHMADRLAQRVASGKYFASLFLTMISIESVYLDESVNQTCRRLYDDWQKLYADHLVRFGFSEEESVPKAQAIFALIHGSMISSWIKRDPVDLMMAKKALCGIIGER